MKISTKIKSYFLLMTLAGINISAANAQEELILFTFGDSITAGMIFVGSPSSCYSGVSLGPALSGSGRLECFGNGAEGVGGYQPELKQSFEEFGYDVSIYNYGYSGITTAEMVSFIGGDLNQQPNSDYVLLMGGANDAFDPVAASTVKFNMQNLVNQVCARGMTPVLATVTENRIFSTANAFVLAYNEQIQQIDTGSSNCAVIPADQYNAVSRSSNFSDNLHLSSSGNTVMADEWFQSMDLEDLTAVTAVNVFNPAVIILLLDE